MTYGIGRPAPPWSKGSGFGLISKGRSDIILRPGPTRGSFTVYPYQVGIIIADGILEYVFEEEKRTLPKGEVRTYVVSTAPFRLLFQLKLPWEPSEPEDIVLDPPLTTSDAQHVTGRIDLTVSVITQGSVFTSVMPEGAHRLLQLLGLDGDVITKSDIANVTKSELLPKLLALDLHGYEANELRSNRDLLRDISGSLKTELASTIDRFGLQLVDFYVNWGSTPDERQRSVIRGIEGEVERRKESDDALFTPIRHDPPAKIVPSTQHPSGPVRSEPVERPPDQVRQAYPEQATPETSGNEQALQHPSRLRTHRPPKRLNRRPSSLYRAAEKGYTDLVKALISSGADANATTDDGLTPLHAAAMRGRTKAVKALISSGADANVMTKSGGLTPLDYATLNGHTKTVQVLVSAQAAINERLDISEPVMLITVNRSYRPDMTGVELYEATRKWWVVGERREGAKYAIAKYKGEVLEIYEIHEWYSGQYKGKTRWAFRGQIASREIRGELRNKTVLHLHANPILYLNC